MGELVDIINQVGFPIALCVYFAWDRTVLMKSFMKSNDELAAAIRQLCNQKGVGINGS
ncbi:MAG: hypothetical protein JJE29_00455 [Peptostreptococcaceae bacterium]|nr:hypothetical protein [Peptostreptococcaceae bacterium]